MNYGLFSYDDDGYDDNDDTRFYWSVHTKSKAHKKFIKEDT